CLPGLARRMFMCQADGDSLTVHLVQQGYMPCSPELPRMAISLGIMQVLHHARVQAYVSHEAFARILCDLHGHFYKPYLRQQIAQAYDAYVLVMLELDKLVKHGFGHDTPHWRMQNSCSACEYRLEGEPELAHTKLVTCDGNNSSKRFFRAGHQDGRHFESDYILSPDFVDQFKSESRNKSKGKSKSKSKSKMRRSAPAQADPAHEEEPDDGHLCTDKWKTSHAQERPSHWMDGLDATGNFLCSCRHGMILCSADMLQSGELSKYPLACISKLMDVHGHGLAMGYDIGCDHAKTIARSTLGEQAQKLDFRMFVGAFHGYAHHRKCQLSYHPRFLMTAGLETFETNEWIFSKQNLTAHLFRYASPYHRHMTLHFFWARWDEDRRAGLADLLYKSYTNALDILQTTLPELRRVQADHHLNDDAIRNFIQEERDYFDELEHEPEGDDLVFKYMETLKELHAQRSVRRPSLCHEAETSSCSEKLGQFDKFINTTPDNFLLLSAKVQDMALTYDYNSVLRAQERLERLALRYEAQLAIDQRWTPEHPQWQEAEHALAHREYNLALDHLEGLVVQRLFEMEKLNLRGTGYAMRTSIAKAIQERSAAIRSALDKYNHMAILLVPPRPTLDFQEVIDMTFLSDFALLRYSRNDIRKRQWSDPLVRQAMTQWLLVRCAKEEIKRLNIEIRRLWTALHVEPKEMLQRIEQVQAEGNMLLAAEMSLRLVRRLEVDKHLRQRILMIFQLDGFSGDRSVGIRMGHYGQAPETMSMNMLPKPKVEIDEEWEDVADADGPEDDLDDDVLNEFDRMNEAFSKLGLP
ncbi:hypothetical protein CALVIDRAFT_485477, partial [Calocera viscosa TUFC12733]